MSWLSNVPNDQRVLFINTTFQISTVHSPSMPLDVGTFKMKHPFSVSNLIKMENALLMAAQNTVHIASHQKMTMSLNELNRGGYFAKMTDEMMHSVLWILSVQCWDDLLLIFQDDSVSQSMRMRIRSILFLRDLSEWIDGDGAECGHCRNVQDAQNVFLVWSNTLHSDSI